MQERWAKAHPTKKEPERPTMTDGIEAITTQTLSLALDAATQRHKAIAANIANVNTADYVPMKLNFEAQLAEAKRTLQERGTLDRFTLEAVRMQLEPVLDANGLPAKVQVDEQMAEL